jgi:uncharacterized phage-like protein YoqJ
MTTNEAELIKKRLESELIQLIHQGVCYFSAGGALGFDTLAASAVLRLKREFTHIRLTLVLPCKDQAKGWSAEDIKKHNQIRDEADLVVYTSEHLVSVHKGATPEHKKH